LQILIVLLLLYFNVVHNIVRKSLLKREPLPLHRRIENTVIAILVVMFLLQSSLAKQAFGFFTCFTVTGSKGSKAFLVESMEEECWTKRHIGWVIFLGLPMLIVFALVRSMISKA
jgi:hypothetical protein